MLLGAATFTNYLAVFVACAALLRELLSCGSGTAVAWAPSWFAGRASFAPPQNGRAVLGFAVWLPADLWFFLAQRGSRAGQFAPFDLRWSRGWRGIQRRLCSAACRCTSMAVARTVVARRCAPAEGVARAGGPALAPHFHPGGAPSARDGRGGAGGRPAAARLRVRQHADRVALSGLCHAVHRSVAGRRTAATVCGGVLAVQAVALWTDVRPETMQPARATAIAAAALAGDGVVLLPHGNDGVGIVGAFAIEAPPGIRLMVIRRDESSAQIGARVRLFARVARTARAGRRQPCDVAGDARDVRQSMLASGGRRGQRDGLRRICPEE